MGVLNQQNNMMDMIPRKNANESYRQQTNKTPKKSWSAYFHTAFSIACLLGYAFVVTAAPFVPSDQELDPNCAPGDVDCYVDISSGGITSLGGLTGATQTFAVGSSGTDFAVSSSGTTHTFNIPTASATNRGLLSTSDWTTFNAKESALTFSSPLSRSVNTISIDNAAADGSTKGAATFTASDFDASSGLISIDYTNGQAASNSTKGFLTSADWTTFNAKQDALTVQNGLTLTGTTLKLGGTMTEDTGILYDPAVNYIAFGDANSGLFAFGNLEDPLDPPIISFLVNGVNAVTINSTGGFDVSADSDITLTSATDVDLVGAGMNLTSDTSIIGNAQNIALNGDVDIMLSSISGTSTSTVYTSLNGWASTSAKVLEETVAETGYYAAINDPVTGEGFSNIYWGILDGSNVITDISRISVGLDDTSTAFAEIHVVIDPTGVVSNFNGFDALPSRTQMAYNADDTMGATGLVWGIDSGGWTANNALNDLFTINTSGQIASTINTSGYTASFTNDGNNTNRSGLLVQAGLYDQSSAGPSTLIQFNDGDGTAVGSITFGSSATAYNTSSDRRLKENIEDTSLSIDTLREIQIRDFTWKADSTHALAHGVIAQELYEVYPLAVTRPTDPEKTWMVDYSKLTPLIVKSVQDLDVKLSAIESIASDTQTTFIQNLISWLGDTANGILNIFSEKVTTKQFCIVDDSGETCLDRSQVDSLIDGQSSSTVIIQNVVNDNSDDSQQDQEVVDESSEENLGTEPDQESEEIVEGSQETPVGEEVLPQGE